MRTIIISTTLFLALSATGLVAEVNIKEVNGIEFHAPMLEQAVVPKPYLDISLGTGDSEVGGSAQDVDRATEEVPVAFLPQKDGSIWILDAVLRKLTCFAPTGKHVKTVSLTSAVATTTPPLRDFALGPEFGFYLLDPSDRMIKRLDKDGKVVATIEGLGEVRTISADATGNVFADDPISNSIFCFNPAGELVWQLSGIDGLSPYTDGRGNPLGISGDDTSATLFKISDPLTKKRVELGKFSLDIPAENQVTYAHRRILGVDDNGNIHFELLATNPDGVVFQHRFYRVSPDGKTVRFKEIQVVPFFAPDIARDFVVLPEGRILGFTADETTYRLLTYDVNP